MSGAGKADQGQSWGHSATLEKLWLDQPMQLIPKVKDGMR